MAWKEFAPAFILVFNSLVWFTVTNSAFSDAINKLVPDAQRMPLFAIYYVGIALSALSGAVLFPRMRDNYLLLWIFAGTVVTALLSTISSGILPINILISILFGISIGIGLPSCLAYFADATLVENRGICGGIT